MNIVIANSKGGAGKSTTAIILSLILSKNNKTILIDSGYQRHSTEYFLKETKYNLLDLLLDKNKKAIYKINENLDIIPATIKLNDFRDYFQHIPDEKIELVFRSALPYTIKNYEHAVFDTESSLNALTRNALIMADIIIIPIFDRGSIDEAEKLILNINNLQEVFSQYINLKKIYILPVMKRMFTGYKTIMKYAEKLKAEFLPEVKYNRQVYINNKLENAVKDYEKSLRGIL